MADEKRKPADRDEIRKSAEEINGYLDERLGPDAGADEDAAAVIDAHEKDPAFPPDGAPPGRVLGLGD